MGTELTYQKAIVENDRISGFISSTVRGLRLQGGVPDSALRAAVHAIAHDEEFRKRGEFLSVICRLPDGQRNALMEYVQQSRPYERTGFSLKTVLQNQGKASLRIIVGVQQIQRRSPADGTPEDRWEDIPTYRLLEPGDDIELPPDRAVNVLWKHGFNALSPYRWNSAGNRRKQRAIFEVAYEARWTSEEGIPEVARGADSEWLESRRDETDKIVEKAKALKSESGPDALKLLRSIPEWWPKSELAAAMIDKLERGGK